MPTQTKPYNSTRCNTTVLPPPATVAYSGRSDMPIHASKSICTRSRFQFLGPQGVVSVFSTLLETQSRLGDKPLKFQVVCPQNGTAVLKGFGRLISYGIWYLALRAIAGLQFSLVLKKEGTLFEAAVPVRVYTIYFEVPGVHLRTAAMMSGKKSQKRNIAHINTDQHIEKLSTVVNILLREVRATATRTSVCVWYKLSLLHHGGRWAIPYRSTSLGPQSRSRDKLLAN